MTTYLAAFLRSKHLAITTFLVLMVVEVVCLIAMIPVCIWVVTK